MPLSPGRERAMLGILVLVLGIALLFDHAVVASIVYYKAPLLDVLVGIVNPIGSGVTLLVVCVALAVVCHRCGRGRLQHAPALAALAFMVAGLLEFTLKHLIGRPRPDAALATVGLVGASLPPDTDSFPSGHATSVFAVATIFAAYYPRLRGPLYALAATIALGRLYLVRHYVSDIVAGAALGIMIAVSLHRRCQALPPWMTMKSTER